MTLLQCWHRVPGGTGTSIVSLAGALDQRDDLDVVGVGPWGFTLPPPPWTPPVPVTRLPLPHAMVYDCWHRLRWPGVERVSGRPDVVHATTTMIPPTRRAALVVTVHDIFPLTTPENFTARGVRLLTRGIELARRHADIVCSPSQNTIDACVDNGFDPARMRLIPWGFDPPPVSPADRARIRNRYSLDGPYLLWVGTVEPRKNLVTLLRAYKALQPLEEDLVLVGPPGWGSTHIEDTRGVAHRVRRLGFVAPEDLPAIYAEARAFCFPSLREGFGLPPLEAMAYGVPVITSKGTACEEVVGEAGTLVEANDIDGWVDAIRTVCDDEGLRLRMSIEGSARAEAYRWDLAAERTVAAYRDALDVDTRRN